MNNKLKFVYIGIILLLCQVILGGYINIWPLLYIAVFPQIILIAPPAISKALCLLTAFVLGMGADLLADGVPGLNAAALVAMAYFRLPILKLVLSKANIENNENLPITSRYVEIPKLLIITLLCFLIFFTVYVLIDFAGGYTLGYTLLKIVLCTLVNSVIALFCNLILFEKIFR